MARRTNWTRVKAHRVYTVAEAAEALDRHRRTITRWIKYEGLVAETGQRPWLIRGQDLKDFLGAREARRRQKMPLDHLYCLGCKSPQRPDGRMADYCQKSATTGQLTGLCPACGSWMHKIIKRADLETIRATVEVTIQQANPGLVSLENPRSHVHFDKESETHGKARLR